MESAPQLNDGQGKNSGSRRQLRSRHVISDETWESHREEIYRIYVKEKNTLSQTMQVMEATHKFKASKRKYKMKLKEWNLEKNLSATDMKVILAKESERAAREGKETVFIYRDQELSTEKIENFKKRMHLNGKEIASPNATTPPNITYHTPRADYSTTMTDEIENKSLSPRYIPNSTKSLLFPGPWDLPRMQMVDKKTFLDDDQLSFDEEDSIERYTAIGPIPSAKEALIYPSSISDEESIAEATVTAFELEDEPAPSVTPFVTPLQASYLNASLDLDIRLMKNHQDCYAHAYRQVAAGCKKLCEASFVFVLQAMSALGVLRDEQKGYKEAESKCRQTIERFEKLGTVENRLDFHRHLDVLLRRTGRAKESVVLLYSTTPECNKVGLKHQDAAAIRSFLDSYLGFYRSGYVESVEREILKMLDAATETEFDPEAELSSKGVQLRNAVSMLKEFFWTHPTFSSVLPRLEQLRQQKYGLHETSEYWGFYLYNKSQKLGVGAADYLILALRGLVKLGRGDDEVARSIKATLTEVLQAEFEELFLQRGISRYHLLDLILERLSNIYAVESGQGESPTDSEKKADEGDSAESNGRSKDGEDDTMTDTTSCKYGVTYSVTDVTGISDSVFMEP